MSTIMKALQRLEVQRQPAKTTSLQEEIVLRGAPSTVSHGFSKKWILLGVVLFLCIASGVVFFVLHAKTSMSSRVASEASAPTAMNSPARETPPSSSVGPMADRNAEPSEEQSEANAGGLEDLPFAEAPKAAKTVDPDASSRGLPFSERGILRTRPSSAVGAQGVSEAIAQVEAAPTASKDRNAAQATPKSVDSSIENSASEIQASASEGEALPAPPATPSAAPSTSAASSASEPVLREALPAETSSELRTAPSPERSTTRDLTSKSVESETPTTKVSNSSLPEFRIRRTVWHPQSERRIAVIELLPSKEVLNLSEGDTIGMLTVKQIMPSNVVFLHGSVEVTRRVGELP